MMAMSESRWIEISKKALIHNYQQVQTRVGPRCGILAVVKANAYGLGMAVCGKIFQEQGASMLGVTTFEEAAALRKSGLMLPILVFGPLSSAQIIPAAALGLTVTVTSPEALGRILEAIVSPGQLQAAGLMPLQLHLKIETGMGRFGLWPEEAVGAAQAIAGHPSLKLAGVYTHFATAGESKGPYFRQQKLRFQDALRALEEAGFKDLVRHCANSAALLAGPECDDDMVRIGTLLYGQNPASDSGRKLDLLDPWKCLARVLEIRELPAGKGIGYGATFITKRPTRVAVLPVGYSDGFQMEPVLRPTGFAAALKATLRLWLRCLKAESQTCHVYFDGKPAPVIGKVGMQLTMVDVTDLPQVRVGDAAHVPLRRTAADSAIPRIYVD
jgi:alanine racemase